MGSPPEMEQEIQGAIIKGETVETNDIAQTETENMDVDESSAIDVKSEDTVNENVEKSATSVPADKAEIAVEEKSARRSRWGTRWTKEAPEVKIGKMLSAPAAAPEPVAKTDATGKKLTKSQRKKLKKKRRKETKRGMESDSGIDTSTDSDQSKKKSTTEKNL